LSPVSAAHANGVSRPTRYAASVLARIAILVTLVACNEHDTERLTAIKLKVCACKTASCAEQELKRVPESPIKSTHRTQEIARDLLDCVARLQEAERPTTDPDELEVEEPHGDEAHDHEAHGHEAHGAAPSEGAPPSIAPPSKQ
jgi:hypothetical protein